MPIINLSVKQAVLVKQFQSSRNKCTTSRQEGDLASRHDTLASTYTLLRYLGVPKVFPYTSMYRRTQSWHSITKREIQNVRIHYAYIDWEKCKDKMIQHIETRVASILSFEVASHDGYHIIIILALLCIHTRIFLILITIAIITINFND